MIGLIRNALRTNTQIVPTRLSFVRTKFYFLGKDRDFLKKGVFEERDGHEGGCLRKTENKDKIWEDAEDDTYTKVKEVGDHWHFVERLKPKYKAVPTVSKDANVQTPSGWKPPLDSVIPKTPYFIERTKNNMLPVYYLLEARGPRELTIIKKAKGDIWALESELKEFLQVKHKRNIESAVHEFVGNIKLKGNYTEDVKDFLYQRGF